MEIVYLILLFMVPGLLLKVLNDSIKLQIGRKDKKGTLYESLFGIVGVSVFVSGLALTFLVFIMDYNIKNMPALISELDNFKFLLKYLSIDIAICLFLFILGKMIKGENKDKIIVFIKNTCLRKQTNFKIASSRYDSWGHILTVYNDEKYGIVISMHVENEMTDAGFLSVFDEGAFDEIGMVLEYREEVMEVLNSESYLKEGEFVEYVSSKVDTVFRVHESKIVYEHWGNM